MTSLAEIVKELDWDFGDFIPVANDENRELEIIFQSRRKELQKLKEELEEHENKWKDLELYKKNLFKEHDENNKLLMYHKMQMENECDSNLLATSEINQIDKNIKDVQKESDEINEKNEQIQGEIADTLRKIENLRKHLGEERGALEEWNAALKRSEANIDVLNQFSKEDASRITELDNKRQRLKIEHDKKQQELANLCTELEAEEKAVEKISDQIAEALELRRQTVGKWNEAVENLHQREKDILKMKHELELLHEYADKKTTFLEEKKEFLESIKKCNKQAETELEQIRTEYEKCKLQQTELNEELKEMENDVNCLRKELTTLSKKLSESRLENKFLLKEISTKEENIKNIEEQIKQYNAKLEEINDGSKTAAQRQHQLDEMYNSEEKYINKLQNEYDKLQKNIHSTEQKISNLKNEQNEILIEIEGFKTATSQLSIKERKTEKDLLDQDEIIYKLNIEIESLTSRLARMEGEIKDKHEEESLKERIQHLEKINNEELETQNMLKSQISMLESESRLVTKNIMANNIEIQKLTENLNNITAEVDGGEKQLVKLKKNIRQLKTEYASVNLKVIQTEKILKNIGENGCNIQKAQIELESIINEKLNEVNEREAYNIARHRTLQDECGALQAQLKKEEIKLEQLKKKYDILASSLGKDELGEALSISYFKVKKAQEKAELQQEGDKLEAQICQSEKEIAALEATLQVVNASNKKFIKNLTGSDKDDPESITIKQLREEYNKCHGTLKQISNDIQIKQKKIDKMTNEKKELSLRIENLSTKKEDLLEEIESLQKDLREQSEKLNRARISLKKSEIAARKTINNPDVWSAYKKDIEIKMLTEVNQIAIVQLKSLNLPIISEKAIELGMDFSQISTSELDFLINETDAMGKEESDKESSAQNLSIFSAHSFMDGLSDIGDKESYCSNSNTSEREFENGLNENQSAKSESSINIITLDFPSTSNIKGKTSSDHTNNKKKKNAKDGNKKGHN